MSGRNIFAKLQIMENLLEETRRLESEIKDTIELNDEVFDLFDAFKDGTTTAEELYSLISTVMPQLGALKQDEIIVIPKLKVLNEYSSELEIKCNGGSFQTWTSSVDNNSIQAGITYRDDADEAYIDLCSAEVMTGELAEMEDRASDNRDIDIRVWTDPYSEDYTDRSTISYEDIVDAFQKGNGVTLLNFDIIEGKNNGKN